jgi:hypothetical protein
MYLKDIASKAGIFLFAALMLLSTSGIHSGTCNVPNQIRKTNVSCTLVAPEVCNPETEHCNACFFTQILNQCVFPVIGTMLVSESFRFHETLFSKAALCRTLAHAINRGPPAAIVLP